MTSATDFLRQFDDQYILGVASMDATHREFLHLVERASLADKSSFALAFDALFKHTQQHFQQEESTMTAISHAAKGEHFAEHRRILGDMEKFNTRVAAGRHAMARAWVKDSVLQWFHTHAHTMDSALAADLIAKDKV